MHNFSMKELGSEYTLFSLGHDPAANRYVRVMPVISAKDRR